MSEILKPPSSSPNKDGIIINNPHNVSISIDGSNLLAKNPDLKVSDPDKSPKNPKSQPEQNPDTNKAPDTAASQQKQSKILADNALAFISVLDTESNKDKIPEEAEKMLQKINKDWAQLLNGVSKKDIDDCISIFIVHLDARIDEEEFALEQLKQKDNLSDAEKQQEKETTEKVKELKRILEEICVFLTDYQKIQGDQEKFNKLINSLPKAFIDAIPPEEKVKLSKAIAILAKEAFEPIQQKNVNDQTSQNNLLATPATSNAEKKKTNIVDVLKASGMGLAWTALFAVVLVFLINFKLVDFAVGGDFTKSTSGKK